MKYVETFEKRPHSLTFHCLETALTSMPLYDTDGIIASVWSLRTYPFPITLFSFCYKPNAIRATNFV
jgi:hypothetical protein